jgi:hypothetical protein
VSAATGRAGGRAAGWGGGSTPAGGVVHAAATTAQQVIIARCNEDEVMWVIYLEVAVAVSLVLFIVWWTMRGPK